MRLVNDYPLGYPRLAALMYSAETFHIIRRFGRLRMRQLVYCQDDIARMERDLIDMDTRDSTQNPQALRSRAIDENRNQQESRKQLMEDISIKLEEYGQLLPLFMTSRP